VNLKVSASSHIGKGGESTTVTIENPSHRLAFFVHLKLSKPHVDPAGDDPAGLAEVLPVLWEDNYVSLRPGETRRITAQYRSEKPADTPIVEVEGWNVSKLLLPAKVMQ
jgi:exo-1,4-beta-D-glucosaminidase